MLRELGRKELDVEVIRTFVGKGIPNLVARSLTGSLNGTVPQDLLERAMPVYERWYTEVNGRTLDRLSRSHGRARRAAQGRVPARLRDNKSGRFTSPLLEYLGLAPVFHAGGGRRYAAQKKPDPAPLLHACRVFDVAPREMLFVAIQ
jgi:phosphoglycolate phosphatase